MDDIDGHRKHLNLRIHQLQARGRLLRDIGRTRFGEIFGRSADRAAKPLEALHLLRTRSDFPAQALDDGVGVDRLLAVVAVAIPKRRRKGCRKNRVIVKRPGRGKCGPKHVLENRRQGASRIQQGEAYRTLLWGCLRFMTGNIIGFTTGNIIGIAVIFCVALSRGSLSFMTGNIIGVAVIFCVAAHV